MPLVTANRLHNRYYREIGAESSDRKRDRDLPALSHEVLSQTRVVDRYRSIFAALDRRVLESTTRRRHISHLGVVGISRKYASMEVLFVSFVSVDTAQITPCQLPNPGNPPTICAATARYGSLARSELGETAGTVTRTITLAVCCRSEDTWLSAH
jgi:hypothetical protein